MKKEGVGWKRFQPFAAHTVFRGLRGQSEGNAPRWRPTKAQKTIIGVVIAAFLAFCVSASLYEWWYSPSSSEQVSGIVPFIIIGIGIIAFTVFAGFFTVGPRRTLRDLWNLIPALLAKWPTEPAPVEVEPPPSATPEDVAQRAMQRAAYEPQSGETRVVDVGVLTYQAPRGNPVLCRTRRLPSGVVGVRPYIVLDVPESQDNTHHRIRLELLDSEDHIRFVAEKEHPLKVGLNSMSAAQSLLFDTLENVPLHSRWHLRVTLDDQVIALHRFDMTVLTEEEIQTHIHEDGEMDDRLAQALDDETGTHLSLNDLLNARYRGEAGDRK